MALILLLVIVLAAMLRWYAVARPSYWMDESFSIATAQHLLSGDWWVRSPLYHFLLGIFGVAFQWNISVLRSLSVLAGLAMVFAGYWVVKHWFNQSTAMVFSLLLAMATLEIAWSRQVRMYMLLQLFFWLALYTYDRWRQHQLHWIWPVLCTLAAIFSHEFGYFVVFAFFWYELLHRFKRIHLFIILASLAILWGVYHLVYLHAPYVNYWWHYLYGVTLYYGILLELAVLGMIVSKRYYKLLHWLVIVWLGWLWCLSFIVPLLQYRYLLMTFPIVLLLATLGFIWLWQHGWAGKCLVGVCVGVLIWQRQLTFFPRADYQLESDPVTTPFSYKTFTPQPNFYAAYQFIREYQTEHPNTRIATPYTDIHRLYTQTEPVYRIFINLTGGDYPTIPEGFDDPAIISVDGETLMVVDKFAEYRMDLRWLQLPKELLWEDRSEPWSTISVYRIL